VPDKARHLDACELFHAPDMYAEALKDTPEGSAWARHLQRHLEDSEGIYLVRCAEGCPVLERARKRGRQVMGDAR
jgi:hypothetical protein